MRITSFAVLEQHAREQYQKRFAEAAEPKVINAKAWATFGVPRSLVWGGVVYWAPPLSYEDGLRCVIAAHALRDVQRAGKSMPAVERKAISLAHSLLRLPRLPWWQLRARFRRWLAHAAAVRQATADDAAHVLGWLLHVEDEAAYMPSDKPVTVDLVANLYAFELAYKRKPASWADYVYGTRHLGRHGAQQDLRSAVASRVGVNANKEHWQQYERDLRFSAGW